MTNRDQLSRSALLLALSPRNGSALSDAFAPPTYDLVWRDSGNPFGRDLELRSDRSSSSTLGATDYRALIARAYRYLRARYPTPFAYAGWHLEGDDLAWSASGRGGFKTSRGLASTNSDLPNQFHKIARERHELAVLSYDIIEAAHEARWLASYAFPDRARKVLDLPLSNQHVVSGLVVLASHLATLSHRWLRLEAREISRRTRRKGFEPIEQMNLERQATALAWQTRARYLASENSTRISTFKLSERVAATLREELGDAAPSSNSVYQYLRSQQRDENSKFFVLKES